MTISLLYIVSVYFLPVVSSVECIQGEGDYTGIRYSDSCTGELCAVWKWQTRSESLIKQGCISGVDRGYTAKVGCRTNNLGAVMCLCDHDMCNTLERTENTIPNIPIVRLPVVQCASKTGTGIFGSVREHLCSSNYCHMMRTETYGESTAPDVVNVFNCADAAEFDFDVRLKSTSGIPALYANGCYKVQMHPKDSVTDCTCSRNNCNTILPIVQSGPVRCYVSRPSLNDSEIDQNHFCDGDYCVIQKEGREFIKGCISVNEKNSWSHIRFGHRHILGVDQWLCNSHLCNLNVHRATKSITTMRSHRNPRGGAAPHFDIFVLLIIVVLHL